MTIREMILSKQFENKSILLLDINPKKTNDRTWCFWDETNLFNEVVSKKWNSALFANEKFQKELQIAPYQYKMIKGLGFYSSVFELITSQKNIHFRNSKVLDFEELDNHCVVKTSADGIEESYSCNMIFNSIYNPALVVSQSKYPLLQQHFIGWFIKTKEPVFTPETATFMDFSIEQNGNTKFMYVLPTSDTEALLEPTWFSKDVLKKEAYEAEIKLYLKKLNVTDYEIIEKEQGNIPMTCYKFWEHNTKNILNIGSAGGWTKASTGFTFKNVTKKSKELVQFLEGETDFRMFHKKSKFWFYDLLFIDVLYKNNALGSKVFSALFEKGNPVLIFKFLDEETNFLEDLQVMWKCPKIPFMKALFIRIFKF
jgi:lycopene beta-cyclase